MKKLYYVMFIFVLFSCKDSERLQSQTYKELPTQFNAYLSSLQLPNKLDFCGERIPIEIPEVRERVEREFYLLLQQPGQIILYLKRAGRYFPMFEKILKEEKAPDDLKFLSVAESALYMSRSGKGAVGLWQFMESTAKTLGLQVDDNVDERRNPELSTYSACKYLKQGYNKHNSWIMAAAGYNMGHTGVNESKEFQGVTDYFEMFLNEETSRYILRIVVIKEIMTHPDKYGFLLKPEQLYQPDKIKTIKVERAIDNLAEWAKKQGTTYKDVKILNPWILKRALPVPKGKAYEIAIPA
jgi:membrane-bound lytic murein transglycosylase D